MSNVRRHRAGDWRWLGRVAGCLLVVTGVGTGRILAQQQEPDIGRERAIAAAVSETRMVEAVRRLVGFGPRMYGTPSNHEAAAWLASAFREAGLEVEVREDTPRDWYQPTSWHVRVATDGTAQLDLSLKTVWPSTGSPSGQGEGVLSLETASGAVCLTSANPAPSSTTGCVAVIVDGRASPSGWPSIGRLRGTWTIPVFSVSPQEVRPLRELAAAGRKVRVSFALEARTGTSAARTIVAAIPGRDRSKYVLFCAHGDSDSAGPGANDNASGAAIVLEIAQTVAAAVKAGKLPQPAWDLRFAVWGGEISSAREYLAAMGKDSSRLQAVLNFDQSGFGSSKDALYLEPDDVAENRELVRLVRAVMKDHLGAPGFPERAASVRTQGGTDSYVFQPKGAKAAIYPAVTLFTSAWDRVRTQPVTEGFPPLNWYADDQPGSVTVDADDYYHSVGDTPANTTDKEPWNMGWCARVGLLSALRLMAASK